MEVRHRFVPLGFWHEIYNNLLIKLTYEKENGFMPIITRRND